MNNPAADSSLTLAQVATRFDVSKRTVARWIELGDLIAFRIGRVVRVPPDELERFVKRHSR